MGGGEWKATIKEKGGCLRIREDKIKPEQSQEDRNVYFGVITDLLEETMTSHLPLSFRRSPPWIQLHLHTSHLLIISPYYPGLLLLRLCLAVSSCRPPPSITISRFNTPLSPFILSFFWHFHRSVSLHSIKVIPCWLSGGGRRDKENKQLHTSDIKHTWNMQKSTENTPLVGVDYPKSEGRNISFASLLH